MKHESIWKELTPLWIILAVGAFMFALSFLNQLLMY